MDFSYSLEGLNLLRKVRNNIVGSIEYKKEYIRNGNLSNILNCFMNSDNDKAYSTEYKKLMFSVINTFALTHSKTIGELLNSNINKFNERLIDLLIKRESSENHYYESLLRVLRTFDRNNLLTCQNIEKFISKIDDFMFNDLCTEYILIILNKLCESPHLKKLISMNERLIGLVIQKFFNCNVKHLIKYLLEFITLVSNDNVAICKILFDKKIFDIANYYIRHYESKTKIHSISLIIIVLSQLNMNFSNESIIIHSISTLINIIKEEKSLVIKIKCIKTLSLINEKSIDLQNVMYNVDGVDLLLKDFRCLYTEEKIKEIEEIFKKIKERKTEKIMFDDFEMNNLKGKYSETIEYKVALIECLASSTSYKEESRKKVVESKEITLILSLLDDYANPLILIKTMNLILSLSRSLSRPVKMILKDYDIVNTLFKLMCHPNIEIQILVTNTICNFLVDFSASMSDLNEYASKLNKLFIKAKNSKLKFNSICALKNMLFYHSSNREIKKSIMKKISYETLLSNIEDQDLTIQEQILLIFRSLLYKNPEDIDEVFLNCKEKLLDTVCHKLNTKNIEIIIQVLYILCNISTGNEQQRSIVFESKFFNPIVNFLDSSDNRLKLATILILNNLLTSDDKISEKRKEIITHIDLIKKLEKISANEENDLKMYSIKILGYLKKHQLK